MAINDPVIVGSIQIRTDSYPIYGTFDRGREYLRAHLSGDSFDDASELDQKRAFVTARRWIDRQSYKDEKSGGDSQFTAFPRGTGETTVPLGVEFAQYELVLVLLDDPDSFNQRSTGSNERLLQAGPAKIEFFSRTDGGSLFSGEGVFPPQALNLISPYLKSKSTIITPVVSGTANKSNVLGIDAFDLCEPL